MLFPPLYFYSLFFAVILKNLEWQFSPYRCCLFILTKHWSLAFSLFSSPSTPFVSSRHKIISDIFVFNINRFIWHEPNTESIITTIVLYIAEDKFFHSIALSSLLPLPRLAVQSLLSIPGALVWKTKPNVLPGVDRGTWNFHLLWSWRVYSVTDPTWFYLFNYHVWVLHLARSSLLNSVRTARHWLLSPPRRTLGQLCGAHLSR